MNHPKPEEWVPFVYGEVSGPARRQLVEHLESCSHCREEIQSWRRSLRLMDSWKISRPAAQRGGFMLPFLKLAGAVALILLLGIVIGRATSPKVDLEKLRAAMVAQVERDLGPELAQIARDEATRTASLTLSASRRYTEQLAQQVWVAVKRDVDTLAVNTDAGLRHMFQLADYKQPQSENLPNQ